MNLSITKKQLDTLTKKERSYFNIMYSKSGVLYISSKPGLAKSSIARAIAKKMGMNYVDVRLSMIDEADLGGFPEVSDYEIDGTKVKVLEYAIPKWAIKANSMPTIVHFEELNRASLPVRNAALQLLLERAIGTEFKFNDNILMLSSGNLGEEDGTDVEEFDSALNNRLIHVKHDLSCADWIDAYGNEHVIKQIVQYLKNNPEEFYKRGKDEAKAYASPRTWTFLSDFIKSTLTLEGEDETNVLKMSQLVRDNAPSYIGNSTTKFLRYLEDSMALNINDVLNNFDKVEEKINTSNRDKKSELLGSLRDMDLKKLKTAQVENLIKFLNIVNEDERVGYLTFILDNGVDDDLKKHPYGPILKAFKPLLQKISNLS